MSGRSEAEARFWSKVDATGSCWEWTAARINGYGAFWPTRRETVRAHRYAWELLVGPLLPIVELDHLCKNEGCVNPDHLEPVMRVENNRRSASPSALNMRKTFCKHGHEFTPANTYVYAKGRACRECARIRSLNLRERRRADAA